MESLLRMFKLEQRLIDSNESESINWHKSIDWNQVNDIRKKLQKDSIDFLIKNL